MNQPQNPKQNNNWIKYLFAGIGGFIIGGLIVCVIAIFILYLLFMAIAEEIIGIGGDVLKAFGF